MSNPLLWLGLSILLLAVSLTALLFVSIPTLIELARVARSAEKLLDLLNRELPPTLQALQRTGSDLGELADEVTDGMQHAHHLVKQVDQSFLEVRQQAQRAHHTTQGLWAGCRAAWQVLTDPSPRKNHRQRPPTRRPASRSGSRELTPSESLPSELPNSLDAARPLSTVEMSSASASDPEPSQPSSDSQMGNTSPLERSLEPLRQSPKPDPDFDPWN